MSPPSAPPYPPPTYYPPAGAQGLLDRRSLWAANMVALVMIWLSVILRLWSGDSSIRGFTQFLVVTSALVGSGMSLAGALGSKRTTDMQNLGLFLWAGFLLVTSAVYLTIFA